MLAVQSLSVFTENLKRNKNVQAFKFSVEHSSVKLLLSERYRKGVEKCQGVNSSSDDMRLTNGCTMHTAYRSSKEGPLLGSKQSPLLDPILAQPCIQGLEMEDWLKNNTQHSLAIVF